MIKKLIRLINTWLKEPFEWSEWRDIKTYVLDGEGHLLQGKVNYLSNAKRFRVTKMKHRTKKFRAPFASMDELNRASL